MGESMILPASDPRLHTAAMPVTEFGEPLEMLYREMLAALDISEAQGRPGLGLAAPQIGIMARAMIVREFPGLWVNPEILAVSPDERVEHEGCLSFPAPVKLPISRPTWIKVRVWNQHGVPATFKLRRRTARCFLHELDHLDGVLITDRAQTPAPAAAA